MVSHYFSVVKTVPELARHPWLLCKYVFDPSGLMKKYDESLAYCHQFADNASCSDFTLTVHVWLGRNMTPHKL
jgi:hypothetical protein